MAKRGVSINDIARIAGVSKATVSNVLNGKGRVGEETRARVLAIAEREGYVASFAAKSLREASTHTMGILTPAVSNEFFSSIVMGIERRLYEAGYTSFVCDTEGDAEREASYVETLLHRQVDGLVFVNSAAPLDLGTVPEHIPTVIIDRPVIGTHPHAVQVGNDVRLMAHDMATTLIDHGCRHIAYLSVTGSPMTTEHTDRYLGFLDALAENGVRLDHALTLRGHHRREGRQEAYGLTKELIEGGHDVDGIVAMGDRVALGAMVALADSGVKVGRDVLVIGCDESYLARIVSPALSSVKRNMDLMADAATRTLLAMLSGEAPDATSIIIPHQVVERASTLGA